MTDTWALRLLDAMDADPPFPDLHPEETVDVDLVDEEDEGTGPELVEPPGPVAPHVLTAAAIGYPTADDAAQILNRPDALARLTELWDRMPPGPDLFSRAGADPGLAELLSATGHGATGRPTPTRLSARRRRGGYALAAAATEQRHAQSWPGGELVRQRLDRAVSVSVGYTGPAGAGRLLRITAVDETAPFRLLVMLTADPADPAGGTVGQSAVPDLAALDAVTIDGPIDPADLTEADLTVLVDSLAWARGDSVTAWRQAARDAGPDSPLHRAALLSRRRS